MKYQSHFYWHTCDFQLSISGLINRGSSLSCIVYIIIVLQPPINFQMARSLQTYTVCLFEQNIFSESLQKMSLKVFNLSFLHKGFWILTEDFSRGLLIKIINIIGREEIICKKCTSESSLEHSVWTFTVINWRNWPWGALEPRC